ncbi:MAG: M13 family metallopeptidase [Gammaproteobacteria bacterium]|nr:M13 family metallopeptidase [Gammaproteobacteria bacterium]
MNKTLPALAAAVLVVACSQDTASTETPAAAEPLTSGVEMTGMDTTVRPQDDFYAYANGTWLKATEIPADQYGWGSYMTLRDDSLTHLRAIVDEVAGDVEDNEAAAKIGNYYSAWMDEARVEELGMSPLETLFADIDRLEDHDALARWFGENNELNIDGPFNLGVGQDDKDSTRYVIFVVQSGLGLPDRDYYFDDSERGLQLRDGYVTFVEKLLATSGYADAGGAARRIMALETSLAKHHWDKEDSRDADKIYNKTMDEELGELLSNFNLDDYFEGIGSGRQDYVIVSQPSYLEAANEIFVATDLNTWKEYARLNTIFAFAGFLQKDVVDAQFEFINKTLLGAEEQQPRWQRAISSMNGNLGELLGQLYVEKHFPPEAKERMADMLDNLSAAYADSIRNLEWMSDETKERALEKLSKFTPKVGYPDVWRDYSTLEISADDLVGNIVNARRFNHYRQIDKLGKPIDRNEWFLPPQTVNAYYNPSMNEIVFPAAYLQPPNFQLDAEDAYNYGAIGVTIGHEIGHGFDDQGSKYDGDGNLKSWWTDEDRANFEERTKGLVEQFSQYEALPGLFVNGEFTLGENIGDLGGTAIALKAYRMSLKGKESPVIDGFTGEQRFFLGHAQSSRIKWREQLIELLIKSDPHSPDEYRVNGVVPNIDDFYTAFDVKEGDALYRPPEERIRIWQ